MTDIDKLNDAIAKHAKWKHYLRQAVATGESEWNVASIALADQCEFGKWLLSLSPADKDTDHYRRVRQLHAELHEAAAEILELALSQRRDEATAKMSMSSLFTKASSELTVAMTNWKTDLASGG